MQFETSRLVAITCALAAAAIGWGCEDEPLRGDGINTNARLSQLEGKLGFLGQNTEAKVSLMVGKQQIAGVFDPATRRFRFDNIGKGPKALVVKRGEDLLTLRFPKTTGSQSAPLSAVIPDTQTKSGDGKVDLGIIKLSTHAAKPHLEAQRNPLSFLDTDGDGVADLDVADLDGDGIANWDDEIPWGDGWEGEDAWLEEWAWEEEYAGEWDDDANGTVDWDEGEADWVAWEDIPEEEFEMGVDEFCIEFPEDEYCAFAEGGEMDWINYCAEAIEDPACAEEFGEGPDGSGSSEDEWSDDEWSEEDPSGEDWTECPPEDDACWEAGG